MIPEAGWIGIVGGGIDFLSKEIYVFESTKKQKGWASHTEIGAGRRIISVPGKSEVNVPIVFGAKALVMIDDWKEDEYPKYKWYKWTTPELSIIAAQVAQELIPQLNGKLYGAQQYLYFMWRKLCNEAGFPEQWAIHQWFKGDYICTTVVFMLLLRVAKRAKFNWSYPYGDSYNKQTGALTPLDVENINNILIDQKILAIAATKGF